MEDLVKQIKALKVRVEPKQLVKGNYVVIKYGVNYQLKTISGQVLSITNAELIAAKLQERLNNET